MPLRGRPPGVREVTKRADELRRQVSEFQVAGEGVSEWDAAAVDALRLPVLRELHGAARPLTHAVFLSAVTRAEERILGEETAFALAAAHPSLIRVQELWFAQACLHRLRHLATLLPGAPNCPPRHRNIHRNNGQHAHGPRNRRSTNACKPPS